MNKQIGDLCEGKIRCMESSIPSVVDHPVPMKILIEEGRAKALPSGIEVRGLLMQANLPLTQCTHSDTSTHMLSQGHF